MPTKRKKTIILIIITLALFVSGLLYYSIQENKESNQHPVMLSSDIPENREYPVNKSINPCIDFYKYACSVVDSNFKLREDRSFHNFAFDDAEERLLGFKKKYFLSLAQKNPESKIEGELKNYYLACMNKDARKQEELKIVDETKKILKKIKTKEQFLSMIAENIIDPSQLSFIRFGTRPNFNNPSHRDLFFDARLMSLPEKSYYKNKNITTDLKIFIEQFFIDIGEESPKQKAAWVFDFEEKLAQEYPTPSELAESSHSQKEISRSSLIKDYPFLRLEIFLVNIPKHTTIKNIMGDDAMAFLNKKLEVASLEELKSIYLYFQLSSLMQYAYPDLYAQRFEFKKKYLGGPDKKPAMQERCTNVVIRSFNKEIDYILLPKIFPTFPKERFIKLAEKVRLSLLTKLNNNSWLEGKSKSEAIRKIKNAKLLLVSPNNEEEWDFNPRASYSATTPIANGRKLAKLLLSKKIKELDGPINTNRWPIGPLTVNAFYLVSYNQIVFPIGVLQPPLYDPNEPEEVNLGAIGSIIGHELGHAIDNHGNRFNADGIFDPWVSPKDKDIFNRKTQHLIAQFDKIGHNGKLTLGENIGDLVGINAAYEAAFSSNNNNNKELKRNFFLQTARLRCEVLKKGYEKLVLKTDPHPLGYARVNELIKHISGFKEAYDCKPGDPMVTANDERVEVW